MSSRPKIARSRYAQIVDNQKAAVTGGIMKFLGAAAIIVGFVLMLPAALVLVASMFVYIVGVTPSWTPALLAILAACGGASVFFGIALVRHSSRT
jgi:hypothetical protein